ncbi:hypothetical protein E2C01_079780 [Portunus trituberculatus]|uniref:Uncharacterized protein n=1 Tax=Portunus trituberculatus TaxID=210409 RepID=A0A5B7IMD3_PORTR|nr:hypothetical protein [Portunus trituberculatus]
MNATKTKFQEEKYLPTQRKNIYPLLGVLIGVVGALVLVAIVVVVVMKLKGDSRRERILRHVAEQGIKLPQAPLHPKDGEERTCVVVS